MSDNDSAFITACPFLMRNLRKKLLKYLNSLKYHKENEKYVSEGGVNEERDSTFSRKSLSLIPLLIQHIQMNYN